MSNCQHELQEREAACADGYCPICMAIDLRNARAAHSEVVRLLGEARKHVTASEIDCSSCADVDNHKAIVKASGGERNPYGCCADLGIAIDAYLAKKC
jgi:hypothetical protein